MKPKKLLTALLFTISYINALIDPIAGTHLASNLQQKIASPTPWYKNRAELLKAVLLQKGIGAEIGVGMGNFSTEILNICNPEELYLIDCWEHQDPEIYDDIANRSNKDQLIQYEMVKNKFEYDSRVYIMKAYSVDAAEAFPDEYFDWVFIDANNSYSMVKEDLHSWWPKIKKGGFLCGHNYVICNIPGGRFGVVPAVNEFIEKNDLTISHLSNERFATYIIPKK